MPNAILWTISNDQLVVYNEAKWALCRRKSPKIWRFVQQIVQHVDYSVVLSREFSHKYLRKAVPYHDRGWPGSLLDPSEGAFELTYGSACITGCWIIKFPLILYSLWGVS